MKRPVIRTQDRFYAKDGSIWRWTRKGWRRLVGDAPRGTAWNPTKRSLRRNRETTKNVLDTLPISR